MQRSLQYFRVQWLNSSAGTLEALLRDLLAGLAVADTKIERASDVVMELEHSELKEGSPVFLHCVSYVPGQAGALVRHLPADATTGELSSTPPPDGHDFLKGACVALVKEDHIIFCGDGLKPEALRYFLHRIAEDRSRPQQETQYDFVPVANKEVLKKVQSEGVKSIGIDATLDEYEPGGQLFETLGGNLKNEILNALRSLWEKDPKFSSLNDEDFHNVNAKVVLTLDKRHAKGVSQEAFDDVAQRTIDSQEPGFYLRTRDNALISYHTVKLLKAVDLPVEHESISYREAWDAMEIYFDELKSHGYVT